MLLSKIDTEHLINRQIEDTVYSEIDDDNKNADCILVFGNPRLMEQRVKKAVELYKNKRATKILFMGGIGNTPGNMKWNENNDLVPEAIRMKDYALKLGIPEEDILIETESKTSIENIINSIEILKQNFPSIKRLILISSEFHIKRCLLIALKYMPNIEYSLSASKDGIFDKDNWHKTEEGLRVLTFEAYILGKYARENSIADIEINGEFNERKVI